MSSLIPFNSEGNLPAYLTGPTVLDINKDVVRGAAFPSMSIKGKAFTIVKDGVRTMLMKPDEPDEVAQSIGVVALRINMNAKSFYDKKFANDDSDGQRPACFSYDGVTPSANAQAPQSKKCAICPHNVWGSKITDSGQKSKSCSDRGRVAVTAPDKLEPMLINVPPGSLKHLREAVKTINARSLPSGGKLQYNMVVLKLGFDKEQASPVLTVKPIGILDDKTYAQVAALYDDEIVRAIVGADDVPLDEHAEVAAPPKVDMDELDAALAAKAVSDKAKAPAAPEAAPAKAPKPPKAPKVVEPDPEPAPAPVAAASVAPAPAAPSDSNTLLSDLDDLLGMNDD